MLVRAAVGVAATTAGFLLAIPAPANAEAGLDGTYRVDFDGAHRIINGVARPIGDTSATYNFTSSCADDGCVTTAVLLNTTDTEAVSAHNPEFKLQFLDGAWRLSLPYDSPCQAAGGDSRNQLLTWTLTPQGGTDVLTGSRVVATAGNSCAGDEPGPLDQPMTATRVGKAAPGILPFS